MGDFYFSRLSIVRAKINNAHPIRLDLRPEYQVIVKEDNLVIHPSNNYSLPSSKIGQKKDT